MNPIIPIISTPVTYEPKVGAPYDKRLVFDDLTALNSYEKAFIYSGWIGYVKSGTYHEGVVGSVFTYDGITYNGLDASSVDGKHAYGSPVGEYGTMVDTNNIVEYISVLRAMIKNLKYTDDLPEGVINLYFTQDRVQTTVLSKYLLSDGSNVSLTNTDTLTSGLSKIQVQLNNKEPLIEVGTSVQYRRGDKSWQTLNTSVVPESTNLYYTNARVIVAPLTGFTSSPGVVSASDTILSAIQKIVGNNASYVLTTDSRLSDARTPTTHAHYQLYSPDGSKIGVYVDTSGQVHIDNNIIQNGSTYITHTESVYSKSDYIFLREGATAALATNTYSGLHFIKYDGVNDGRLVVGNDGVARVGDVGSEQAIVTRINVPTDGQIAYWENANTRLNFRSLVKADVGLNLVDNTTDISKNVLTATKLIAARTISLTGEVTASTTSDLSGTVSLTTTVTNSSVIGKLLTGYVVGLNVALLATDSILGAFAKLQAQINNKSISLNGTGFVIMSGSTITYDATSYQPLATAINTSNIGTQSVSYATNAGNIDGLDSSAFCRTKGNTRFGGAPTSITTADFVTYLNTLGCFTSGYWVNRGSWEYAYNYVISDAPDSIQLAGATVEIIGKLTNYTLRIHTASALTLGVNNADYVYTYDGTGIYNSWRRIWNSRNLVSTTHLPEGINLYYTDGRVITAPLTGFSSGSGTISATDSILSSIQKLVGNLSLYSLSTHTHSGVYEPIISTGTNSQYYRGDKSWQTLDKSSVGLSVVENTALSTWTGSSNITTIGILSSLTVSTSKFTNYNYQLIGQTSDFRKVVILLHKLYTTTLLDTNYCIGRIICYRGNIGSGYRKIVIDVDTASVYNTNSGILEVSGEKAKLVTCTYNSESYLAISLPAIAAMLQGIYFTGMCTSSATERLKVLEYYNTTTSTVLISDVNSTIADYVSVSDKWLDTRNLYINSNVIWHAGNDGAGSTLDADLLDGLQASAFSLSTHNHSSLYQPLDSDLTSIVGLSGTSGFLKKTATNTWTLDTTSYLPLTGGTISGAITLGSTLTLASDPIVALHAATKQYVDNAVQGITIYNPCTVSTTGTNITLSGGASLVVDGITLTTNSRILVKDQTDKTTNGIYYPTTLGTGSNGTWTRTTDADTSAELKSGAFVLVTSGNTLSGNGYSLTTTPPITLGTSLIVFTQYSQAGVYTGGTGITKTGNSFSIDSTLVATTTNTITFTNKTWNGTTIGIAYGGTGATTKLAGFDALSPLTTIGDLIYRNSTNNVRLAGNSTTALMILSSTGTGSVANNPTWYTLSKSDIGLSNVDNTSDISKPISTIAQTALDSKEDSVISGTTTQYYRGDKSWQTLNKIVVGLTNVDNTADSAKNVLTATKLITARTISLTGDVTATTTSDLSGTVSLTTSITNAAVIAKLLTGYTIGSNAVLATTDSILTAFGKIQAQLNNKTVLINGSGFVKASGTTISYDNTSYQPSSTAINTGNIANQSVNYSTNSGNADTVDSLHVSDLDNKYFTVASNGDIAVADLNTFANRKTGMYNVVRTGDSIMLLNFNKNVGSASALQIYNDYGNSSTQIRMSIDSNRYSDWKTIYASNNANLSSVDWNCATLNASGSINTGGYLNFNGKTAIKGFDTWLRINESTPFTSGIYCGGGILRTDGEFQAGSGFVISNSGTVTCPSSITAQNGFISYCTQGIAPLAVFSTTMVNNLNANYIAGYEVSQLCLTSDNNYIYSTRERTAIALPTDTFSINWLSASKQTVHLTTNGTISISNVSVGELSIEIWLTSGSITLPSGWWVNGELMPGVNMVTFQYHSAGTGFINIAQYEQVP